MDNQYISAQIEERWATYRAAIEQGAWDEVAAFIDLEEVKSAIAYGLLDRLRTATLRHMGDSKELAAGRFVLKAVPPGQEVTWDEETIVDEVIPLLAEEEVAQYITRYDTEEVVHHFKVETRKLDALADRRKGQLAEAVAKARTAVPKGQPKLKLEAHSRGNPLPPPKEEPTDDDW